MACKKLGVGLLVMITWLELCMSYSTSCHHYTTSIILAIITSRTVAFWYQLTQVVLENGH